MLKNKLSKKEARGQKKLDRPKAKKARDQRKKELALVDQKHKKKSIEKDLKKDKKTKKKLLLQM